MRGVCVCEIESLSDPEGRERFFKDPCSCAQGFLRLPRFAGRGSIVEGPDTRKPARRRERVRRGGSVILDAREEARESVAACGRRTRSGDGDPRARRDDLHPHRSIVGVILHRSLLSAVVALEAALRRRSREQRADVKLRHYFTSWWPQGAASHFFPVVPNGECDVARGVDPASIGRGLALSTLRQRMVYPQAAHAVNSLAALAVTS